MISCAQLSTAWARMSKEKVRHAFDHAATGKLEANAAAVCATLAAQIAAGTYRPHPLAPVAISKPTGGTRILLVPPLFDRLVQSALASQLSSVLDPTFSDASYGYRPERGVKRACARVRHILDHGQTWVLDADIEGCFDLILHAPVIARLKELGVWQHQTAWLLRQYFRSEVAPGGPGFADASACLLRGLPQGSPLSPLLCNVTLDALDKAFESRGVAFVRYADDFVGFATSEGDAALAQRLAHDTLEPLGLRLNPKKTRIALVAQGFRFLGTTFATEDTMVEQVIDLPETVSVESDGATLTTGRIFDESGSAAVTLPLPVPPTPSALIAAKPQLSTEPTVSADEGQTDDSSGDEPLLRTLYLLETRCTLERDQGSLVVVAAGKETLKIPAARLHQVMAFGEVNLTSGAIALCLENAVPVMILSGRGRYFGVIDPLRVDSVERQRAQFSATNNEPLCSAIRNSMISAKLHNSAHMLKRWNRHRDIAALSDAIDRIEHASRQAKHADNAASLRGMEGAAATAYFGAIAALLPSEWRFEGRRRQPPTDPVNSLLSYGYVVLYYNLLTLVVGRGLHPHLGFFHATRSGHHALVSDLMEEFRAPVVDALVMDMTLNGKVSPEDFVWPEASGEPCLMSTTTRRGFIHAFEKKLNARLRLAGEPVALDYRRRMDGQILQLCSVLQGQYTQYLPFLIK